LQAEIITTGTELLLGEIVNTNVAYLAQQLAQSGLDLYYQTTVGDNEDRIATALELAMQRADVVIITGGLGPTVDDVTRQAVARATGRELVFQPHLLEQIRCFFGKRGRQMAENNRQQAYVPDGAVVVENPVGTAPAFIVETENTVIVTLPGVPHEMRFLTETRVLPYLRQKLGITGVIKSRVLRTCSIGESRIDQLIGDLMRHSNPTVGLAAHPGQTDVRITAKADDERAADALIAVAETELRSRLGDFIYGTGQQTLEHLCIRLLRDEGKTIVLAETDPGALTRRLGSVEASTDAFQSSTLAPNGPTLLQRLGEHPRAGHGHSQDRLDIAVIVASKVRATHGADYGLAVISERATDTQQTYSASLALAAPDTVLRKSIRFRVHTPSSDNRLANAALDMLRRVLLGLPQT